MPIIKANRVILKAVLIEIEAGFLMAKNLVFLQTFIWFGMVIEHCSI